MHGTKLRVVRARESDPLLAEYSRQYDTGSSAGYLQKMQAWDDESPPTIAEVIANLVGFVSKLERKPDVRNASTTNMTAAISRRAGSPTIFMRSSTTSNAHNAMVRRWPGSICKSKSCRAEAHPPQAWDMTRPLFSNAGRSDKAIGTTDTSRHRLA